jgi:hypothetical protein
MSTILNLFPARIQFVKPDGTLTPEAYRALQTVFSRIGGPLGDNGVDVLADLVAPNSTSSAATDTISQPIAEAAMTEMTQQPFFTDTIFQDITQPQIATPKASGGAAPAGGVGTAAGGYDTAVNRDAAITLLNNIRTALINAGLMT